MRKALICSLLLTAALLACSNASHDTPNVSDKLAFPGAEGFGALATGGKGGETVHVTTLADSGPGSFRAAVRQPGRTVVFDVEGVITLQSNVEVNDNTTISGETAPGKGVTLYNRTLSLSSHKNIIVRYLRCREGIAGDSGKCAINMATSSNVILDHCSIEWGRWDSMGITKGTHDVTVQDCIVGASIDPQRFGALVDTVQNITLARNLWIHNHSRNPKVKGTIQYINNVVYDWGITGLAGGHSAMDHHVDVIGNYLIKGPDSNNQAAGGFTATDHVYSKDNLVDLNRDGKLNGVPLKDADYKDKNGAPTFVAQPWGHPQVPVRIMDATKAYAHAIAEAGCSKERDAIDLRLIAEVKSLGGAGHIMHSDKEVTASGR